MGTVTGGDTPKLVAASRPPPLVRGPPDPASYGALAARTLAAVSLGALLLATKTSSLSLILLVVVSILAIDTRNPFSLKNFLLIYIIMVFGVGGGVQHLTHQPIYVDILVYTVAFLAGYALASMPTKDRDMGLDRTRRPRGKGALSLFALEHALLALIGLNLLFLAFQFYKYGVVGYYQGQGLLDQALTYGQANSGAGAEQIVRFGLSDSAIALVILYARASFESSTPIRYRYPAILFFALPILSLARFNAINGAVILMAIYACERRLSRRAHTAPPTAAAQAAPRVSRVALLILGFAVAVAVAAFVASIRGGFTNKSGGVGREPDVVAMFSSELTPVQAYGDIKANIAILGHPHGRTIVWPLLLKVVPRAWYPDKPLNSGAYYMSVVRPAEWAAGYALPPTFFGDAYLSFGFLGAILASAVLGLAAARLDMGYRRVDLNRIPWFLLIFANFYAVLRDPLSESLAAIVLTMLVWSAGNRLFRPAAAPAPAVRAVTGS